MPSSTYVSALLALPLLASAHFSLNFPVARGADDTDQATFPCGGYPQTQDRTSVSLTEIPISLELGHTENIISVFLAVGNDVGSSFNYELRPTIQEFGPGEFCFAGVPVPADLDISEGTNATVQVVTNAHSGGGLYNCADITFTSTEPEQPSACTNGTGISATPLAANAYSFANETMPEESEGEGEEEPSATESGGASATASGEASESEAPADGASMMTAGWGVLGAAVFAAVALM